MAMKNDDTWKFANEICGKLWWRIGWILFFSTILIFLIIIKFSDSTSTFITIFLMTVECLMIVLSIILVEKAMKKTFDKDGNRKN
ncbi:MAG: SdpI family protein [Oscillospiraceae bacterium]|nr:SdpI family protein [Oscillospiraceae bacterium]